MLETATSVAWKLVAKLPGWVLRRIRKPGKLAAKIKIDLRAKDPGEFTAGGALPQLRLWFTIQNWSPFPVTLDRMALQVCADQHVVTVNVIDRVDVPAYDSVDKPHVLEPLAGSQVEHLKAQRRDGDRLRRLTIYVNAHFVSKLGWTPIVTHIERRDFPCNL